MELSVFSEEHFMREAYKQAQYAFDEGEIPVGAVVVADNKIIARAYNQTEKLNDVTAHAEMLAITAAANHIGAKYLTDMSLYVTLEPCVMCGGALYWSQISKICYAVNDPKRGFSNLIKSILHPKTEVSTGVLETECRQLLDNFFRRLRN